jgi:transposase
VREIRRRTRRKFSPEEKIRIVLEGLRGEESVSDLCRREGIASNLYYRWSKDFLEAGKKQLAGDTVREATSDEVKDLRSENRELKEVVMGDAVPPLPQGSVRNYGSSRTP